MNRLRFVLGRIDPGPDHFQHEHAVGFDEARVLHLAFEIGETF
eukprot:gene35736-48048_t